MSKQHHDPGNKKRRIAEAKTNRPLNTEELAQDLVERGLGSPAILDRRTPSGGERR